jgi:V/A-type H+-transporting ATPase subunit D
MGQTGRPGRRPGSDLMAERVPPGRAGRLWLRGRLEATRRSADLLDHKRQLMRRELNGLASTRDATELAWKSACSEAENWGRRATALGGADDVALASRTVAGRATVEVAWRNTMGVVHPDEPRCVPAELAPADAAAANAGVAPAAAAYRRAIEAAAAFGASSSSFRIVQAELIATERRLRAIQRHRIPELEGALHRLDLRLDELEREERVVTRWAKRRRVDLTDASGASTPI